MFPSAGRAEERGQTERQLSDAAKSGHDSASLFGPGDDHAPSRLACIMRQPGARCLESIGPC